MERLNNVSFDKFVFYNLNFKVLIIILCRFYLFVIQIYAIFLG